MVAVDDTAAGPAVVFSRRQTVPGGVDPGSRAAWFARMAVEAIEESSADGVSVRVADRDPSQERAEAEGAVLAAAGLRRLPTKSLRRQSLAGALGVARAAGSWNAFQATDPFIAGFVADEKDAAMASLAAARR